MVSKDRIFQKNKSLLGNTLENCLVPFCCGIPQLPRDPICPALLPPQTLNNWGRLGPWAQARLMAFQLHLLWSSFLPSGSWWLSALTRGGRTSYPISLFLQRTVWDRHLCYVPRFWVYFRGLFFFFKCLDLTIIIFSQLWSLKWEPSSILEYWCPRLFLF